MKILLAIFIGGGTGSLARYGISRWLGATVSGFPMGTLSANFIASLILGILAGLALRKTGYSPTLQAGLMTGFCGGFSTFSTFSLETFGLFSDAKPFLGLAYVLASVVLCITGIFLGHLIARTLIPT